MKRLLPITFATGLAITLAAPATAAPNCEALNGLKLADTSITEARVNSSGAKRSVVADLEWTFPLNFVEVVWGDGKTANRQVISATDVAPMGSKHFEIPFDATGKKWVRFAVWDTAGNGAFVQPIRIQSPPSTGGR